MDFAAKVYAAVAHVEGLLTNITVTPLVGSVYTGKVGFNEGTEMVLGGEVIASSPSIRFATANFISLAKGDTVTIGARSFKISNIERMHDGLESMAPLTKA